MINKAKGTYDLYGIEGKKRLYINNLIQELMEKYNYEYISTPLFENSALFHRSVGETTDIVTKETYDFKDRGNRDNTLRPEGTAGVVRSYIENKMYSDPSVPKKLWYYGPMYRYERPQSGRYREFYQFGCEVLGSEDPLVDAEIISIPVTLFRMLGLKGIKVNINSLGDNESRENYKKALMDYLKPHINDLCEDCKTRYEKNPLRILDCKIDANNEILKNVPKTIDYLNEKSKEHFNKVLKYLEALEIEYKVNPNTIRGLDYYTHTVFEIEADVEGFGSQNVMCGGGRYDNLVESLEGPKTKAVGFAIGIERLMMALEHEKIKVVENLFTDCYILAMQEEQKPFAFAITTSLRMLGLIADMDYQNRTLKANFKQAERLNSRFMLIIGEDEVKNNYITIKDMKNKTEEKVENTKVLEYIITRLEDNCSCDDKCSCDDECNCEDHCKCNCKEDKECTCKEE